MLRELIAAGMDVARINFSHGTQEEHRAEIRRVRALAQEMGRPVAVMADLQGPKLRTGEIRGGKMVLEQGARVTITTERVLGGDGVIPCNFPQLPQAVSPGDAILLADGALELCVEEVGERAVRCRVVAGGELGSHKGINLPGLRLPLPAMTDKDRADLSFALAEGVDYVALSFVRSAEDVKELKLEVHRAGAQAHVCAKIEKPQAIDHLETILALSDVVMVARGDLGVEMSPEKVPVLQKRIISEANRACVPVITATQMLESMISSPRPTRAEASDVANAIFDGTDAVMLSGETAIGRYPIEAVRMMSRIIVEAERSAGRERAFWDVKLRAKNPFADAVAHSACQSAADIGAKGIVVLTRSGYTALLVSKRRPQVPVVGVTASELSFRQMALYWGVQPLLARQPETSADVVDVADRAAACIAGVENGDVVVTLSGAAVLDESTTHALRLHRVGVTAREFQPGAEQALPVVFDSAQCMGCGLCAAVCKPQIIEVTADQARIVAPLAHLCDRDGACVEACPTDAVRLAGPGTEAEVSADHDR